MKNEAEQAAALFGRFFDCHKKMLQSISKRGGNSPEEAELLLRLFDGKVTLKDELPQSLTESGLAVIDDNGEAVLTGKGAILAKSMSTARARLTEALLSGITPEQRFVLLSTLETVIKNGESE